MSGIVHLVGAGPGDPGLLTLRGGELLVLCDAVVYDALANPALLGLATAHERQTPVELHDVGKRGGTTDSARQDEINALLIRLAKEGKRVVRLKGGDPFVFGRGSEEAQALAAAGVRFEVVPGVTAGIAAPAYAGIPVTHRGAATSVTFVTGHEDPAKGGETVDWSALARAGGTIVLYMGVRSLLRITAALLEGGMPAGTPAAAVQWGTYPRQRTVVATVSTLVEAITREELTAPVITVIGDVVSLRPEISWFETRPLFGKTVVVTRARSQASSLTERLAQLGADVLEMPATRIEAVDPEPLRRAIGALGIYKWVIFTSQNAVPIFWRALRDASLDVRALGGIKIGAVGLVTRQALAERGLIADVLPERFVAEGLLEAMRGQEDVQGARVLYVAATGARETLRIGLEAMGATVDRVPVYSSVPDAEGAAELRAKLLAGETDAVTFTSASSVNAFVDAVGADAATRAPAISIGPVTTAAARRRGLDVATEASSSTIAGLADAACELFAANTVRSSD
ncbi:MAG: uroporphyrinogen-III C-methyltransferase [Gemmatimonadaceae bacterium]